METLKIVDANPYFYPSMGGIEKRMHLTSKLMAERGHDVTILTAQLPGTPAEEETEFGYKVVRVPSKFYNVYNPPYVSCKGTLDKLNELKPDVVNYNYRWAFSMDGEVGKYKGKKVFTYHNMWGEGIGYQRYVSEINDRLYRKNLKTYDHIIAVSDHVKQDLIRRNVPENHITAIDNFLEDLPELMDEEGEFILSLGRKVVTKGLRDLVKAMRDVDYKLIMCGRGPEEKVIGRMIKKYGLEDRIEQRSWVSEEEKNRLMGTCKFFVMPSLYESYGLAAAEALSYGKPLVCTNVNGLPDTVKDAGLYVKPKDPEGLATEINRLLKDEDLRSKLSANAVKVTRSVDVSKIIDNFEDVLYKVVDGTYSRDSQ